MNDEDLKEVVKVCSSETHRKITVDNVRHNHDVIN
jgi:hypothetical protein